MCVHEPGLRYGHILHRSGGLATKGGGIARRPLQTTQLRGGHLIKTKSLLQLCVVLLGSVKPLTAGAQTTAPSCHASVANAEVTVDVAFTGCALCSVTDPGFAADGALETHAIVTFDAVGGVASIRIKPSVVDAVYPVGDTVSAHFKIAKTAFAGAAEVRVVTFLKDVEQERTPNLNIGFASPSGSNDAMESISFKASAPFDSVAFEMMRLVGAEPFGVEVKDICYSTTQ